MHNQYETEAAGSDNSESPLPGDLTSRLSRFLLRAGRGSIQSQFAAWRFLMITIGGIFLAETAAMTILLYFRALPYYLQTLIDSSIMVFLISPVIYVFSLKPLLLHIEERRRAEIALLRSEERFVKAFHSSPAALSITRIHDGDFIDVNRSFLRLTGYERGEVIGYTSLGLGMYVNPEIRVTLTQQTVMRHGLSQEGVRDYELEMRLKSGEIRTILISTEGIELDGEACILASISDVTERRLAEMEIRQLSRIVEQTEDSVVVTNREGVIEYINPAFERLTGYTQAEALGKTPRVIKSGIHDDQFYRNLWETILKGEVFQGEMANRKKNGEVFYEVKTVTPLRNDRGAITHFVATGKDITDHKLDEDKLRKAYDELELRVQDRTEELRIANSELEDEIAVRKRAEAETQRYVEELMQFNRAMVGRELRMIELKKEVNTLCGNAGLPPRYSMEFVNEDQTIR